ncbi:hypothetical protein BRADI_1g53265v3 [Brachypodium distachyon]|uniref:Uncharacterized protein n=1 Tax=Brachypodium distachyon TaxID=15368 RepID=A0A2K2DR62_BRADI|nr:hypothetical protein BRADI_1g53265v3 [Brachypodium distachyon]
MAGKGVARLLHKVRPWRLGRGKAKEAYGTQWMASACRPWQLRGRDEMGGDGGRWDSASIPVHGVELEMVKGQPEMMGRPEVTLLRGFYPSVAGRVALVAGGVLGDG